MTRETKKPWNHRNLVRAFDHADTITHNYAQSDQDIFVLSRLNGLHTGTYLEIGAGWPLHISNTALLELEFGWTGISIDYQEDYPQMWQDQARKTLVQADALKVDFHQLLSKMPTIIDYLSLDCDPGWVTLEILKRVPLDLYRFKVITFEHDCHAEGPAIKLASRQFLQDHGYQMVVGNISEQGIACDYEDWWVHPDLVDHERLQAHTCLDDCVKNYKTYLYKLNTSLNNYD